MTTTPEAPRASAIETRSIDWVPENERHGRLWHQAPLWFLGNFQYFSIPIGFIGPSLGLSIGWTVVASLLGLAVGTLFMAFHATQGPQMGLPQMIQSRAQFGYRGVIVPLFATLFTYVAFNVTDQVLLGLGLDATYGWNAHVIAVIAAVGAALLAIYGHDWLHRFFRAILYVSLPLTTILTVGVLVGAGGGHAPTAHFGFSGVAFMAQFSAAAAYNITYAPYVSDYSRYLPTDTPAKKVIASVFFGAAGAALWLMSLGAWLAVRLGASDGLAGLQLAGNNVIGHLGDIVAFLSALALAATMGMNAYGGMLSVLTAIDSFKPIKPTKSARIITIVGLAVVWYVIGEAITGNAVNTVLSSLTLMLYLLVPWTATNLVDYFFVRRGHYAITELFRPHGIYDVWAWRGLLAYAIGFVCEIPFMILPTLGSWSYTGWFASKLNGVDIAWIVGLAVSSIAYLALTRSLDLAAEKTAEQASRTELAALEGELA